MSRARRYAEFVDTNGERVSVDPACSVRTLRGEEKLAGSCTPDEVVLLDLLGQPRVRVVRVDSEFRSSLRRVDGRGVSDPTVREVPAPEAHPTELRGKTQRGWAQVWSTPGFVRVEFAPWVNARVAGIHLRAVLAVVECDVDRARADGAGVHVPLESTDAAVRVACSYLVDHGFAIKETT